MRGLGEAPGIIENIACWIEPSSNICRKTQQGRYARETEALAQEQRLAEWNAAVAAAQQGAQQAVQAASTSQIGGVLLMILPPLALVGLGIGGYLWYRKTRQPKGPYSHLSEAAIDARLSQLVEE